MAFIDNRTPWQVGVFRLVAAVAFVLTPKLYRYGDLVAPLTFICIVYVTIFDICRLVGTDSGLQFYFLAAASFLVLALGIEHIALVGALAGVGVGLTIGLEFLIPADTGRRPDWALKTSFVFVIVSAFLMVVITMWYALRVIARAEAAMEAEYGRSESLLANILPASIAQRLKDPVVDIIADSYADASVLFADIADFTSHASQVDPHNLVIFLNRLYTKLDWLVDRHGLEKIKTTGDSYMVVSGVPDHRPDHLQALARLALGFGAAVAEMRNSLEQPVQLRIGVAAGPVVAGVVGTRRFFYDVWGDTVNLASRMETTDRVGRIQVSQDVYERLKDEFVFEERGDVQVKGKGVMHTWYLVGERPRPGDRPASKKLSPNDSR